MKPLYRARPVRESQATDETVWLDKVGAFQLRERLFASSRRAPARTYADHLEAGWIGDRLNSRRSLGL